MAGRDYAWLVASVKSWTRRTDLTAIIPDLILFAEERMSADLEARGIESVTTIATVAGTPSVALPPEIVEVRSIRLPGHEPLVALSADRFNARYHDGETGAPRYYKVVGDAVYFGPIPDAVYQLRVDASKTLPPLSAANTTNWLILRNPSLYLAATVLEAMVNLRDDAGITVWGEKYQLALNTANSTKATAGQLVARPDTSTP